MLLKTLAQAANVGVARPRLVWSSLCAADWAAQRRRWRSLHGEDRTVRSGKRVWGWDDAEDSRENLSIDCVDTADDEDEGCRIAAPLALLCSSRCSGAVHLVGCGSCFPAGCTHASAPLPLSRIRLCMQTISEVTSSRARFSSPVTYTVYSLRLSNIYYCIFTRYVYYASCDQ
jgi:hypothetical protein